MEKNFQEQIDSLKEDLSGIDNFAEFVVVEGRNDLERKFREAGKKHRSVIGQNNSCVDSIDHLLGGCLHNEIGLINDCLENLYKGLKRKNWSLLLKISNHLWTAPSQGGDLDAPQLSTMVDNTMVRGKEFSTLIIFCTNCRQGRH